MDERKPKATDDAEGAARQADPAVRPSIEALHDLVGLLVCSDLQTALGEVLKSSILITGADGGRIQVYDASSGTLETFARLGPVQSSVGDRVAVGDDALSAAALAAGRRVVVPDTASGALPRALRGPVLAGCRAAQSTPVLGRDGEVLGMLSTYYREPYTPSESDLRVLDAYARHAADVVEQRRTEEGLRQRNEDLERRMAERAEEALHLAALVESARDAIYSRDLEGRITTWNQGAEGLYGYAASEVIGKSHLTLIPSDGRDQILDLQEQLLRGEEPPAFETWLRRKGGDVIFVSITHSAIVDSDGRVVGIASVGRDMTEYVRAQRALEASQARLRAILDSTADGILSIDSTSRIVTVNPAVEQMFGYEPDELIGQDVKVLMTAFDAKEHDIRVGQYLRTGVSHIIGTRREVIHRRKDGSTFPGDLAVSHLPEVEMFTAVIRDTSDRKLAELREQQHQADLAHMIRIATAGELASGLAHELNQPLMAIANNVQACLSRIGAGQKSDRMLLPPLRQAAKAAMRAGSIVHGIRQMVEKRPPREERVDLREPIRRATTLLRGAMEHHGIQLKVDTSPRLPTVRGDKIQIEQVLINLVQNSVDSLKASERRNKQVSIVAAPLQRDLVQVTVRDNGAGVSAAVTEHLFSPFFSSKEEGLGIGLSLSRTVIESNGGRLWFEPARGRSRGATFCFTLPVYDAVAKGAAKQSRPRLAPRRGGGTRGGA